MYPLETRELAVEAVAAGFSLTEAAELAGCSRTAVVNWAKAAGVAPPPRKKAVYLPFDRKMELVARLEAGERAADLAAEAGVTAAAVSGWRRRLREEGALSLMTDSDIAARAPEPREAPSELEELRARCEELELRNAVLEGTIDIGTVKNLAHFSDSLISPPSGAATPPAESRPDSASSPTRSRPRT